MAFANIDASVLFYTLSIYVAIVVSPGPNFALVSRLALRGDRARCYGAIIGLATAATFYATLALAGLAAFLDSVGWVARLAQVAGGLYLIYLGFDSWRMSTKSEKACRLTQRTGNAAFGSGFRQGLLLNLSNPKAIAFFVGLYAVAIPFTASVETRLAVLFGGAAIEVGWYTFVCIALSRRQFQQLYKAATKWIERAIGTVLMALGALVVLHE